MKYILILISTLIIVLSLKAQNMSIFLKATRSGWYPEFLNPVADSVLAIAGKKQVLDIGTGPGTLPRMLIEKDQDLQVTGIDIDTAMIAEARKITHTNLAYRNQKINAPLEFPADQFDVVTFCSVLFLLDDDTKTNLINEAVRVLKPDGKIIVLTPSGKKSVLSSVVEVWHYPFSVNNFTFIIWKAATTSGGRRWKSNDWLKQYAIRNNFRYSNTLTFNDNAVLETISK
jgi:ubiquinone/menaquinone biosynthesis C-methylase UbiE